MLRLSIILILMLSFGGLQLYGKSGPPIEAPKNDLCDAVKIARKHFNDAFEQSSKKYLKNDAWILTKVEWDRVRVNSKSQYVWFWRVRFEYPPMNEWWIEIQVDQNGEARVFLPRNADVGFYLRKNVKEEAAIDGPRW